MNGRAWQQVDKVFQAAVELDAVARNAFLDVACAEDPLLRSEVESLLTADSQPWDFIDTPALESGAILLDDAETRLAPGDEVGHYEIVKLIGKGGMGEVYLVRDRILNRNIALKLLPFYYTQNDGRLRRFQREAHAASALNHPNIITIHELGSVNDQQFIATEFIEGETLRELINRGPVPLPDAIDIAIQTASALAAAHKAGIVHRDIKPENVMLRPDGYVKVLDFGLAKLAEDFEIPSQPVPGSERVDLSSGILMGTLRYMSPEQARGLRVDDRSDIFSLGAVLCEMLTGRPPFENNNAAMLVESILLDEPPSLADLPDAAATIISKALQKDPEKRYQDADILLHDLKLIKGELQHGAALSKRGEDVSTARSYLKAQSLTLVVLLFGAGLLGYASFKFLQPTGAVAIDGSAKLALGTWTTKTPLSSARYQAEPAVLNGRLYVVGGWNGCTPFATLESYDPSDGETWKSHSPMHTPRGAHGVGVLNGLIYAVGGSVDCGVHIAGVEAYDPALDSWSARSSLPAIRANAAVAVANGKLYVIGGRAKENEDSDSTFEYDPGSDSWIERGAMPTKRSGAAVAVVAGKIYVIGGSVNSKNLATVEAYDPTTNSWMSRRSMLLPRAALAVSELNGKIYAFGGIGNRTSVEAYDPLTDTWTIVGELPSRRYSAHAAAFKGSIYLPGGSDGNEYLASVIAFAPPPVETHSSNKCPALETQQLAPMPTRRLSASVGAIGGIIYVVGGFGGKSLAANEAYDPAANEWTAKATMPTARETMGSNTAVVGEKLYVIGGNASGYCTDLNQAYHARTDTWSTLAPMPTARCHLAVIAHDDKVYAIGGTNTSGTVRFTTVEVYDPATDTWTAAPPMQFGRLDFGAVSLNGVIYTLGGWNPSLSFGELDIVEAYDPTTETWTTRSSMMTARRGMAAGVLNGSVVVVGGESNEETLSSAEVYDPVRDAWSALPGTSTNRAMVSSISINDTLYSFGGRNLREAEYLATSEAISLRRCSN